MRVSESIAPQRKCRGKDIVRERELHDCGNAKKKKWQIKCKRGIF